MSAKLPSRFPQFGGKTARRRHFSVLSHALSCHHAEKVDPESRAPAFSSTHPSHPSVSDASSHRPTILAAHYPPPHS